MKAREKHLGILEARLIVVCLSLLLPVSRLLSQWSNDPTINTPVSVAPADQTEPVVISDGEGGVIIVWSDFRHALREIYAQRLDAMGIPRWQENGVVVASSDGTPLNPVVVSDGSGGCIIAWWKYGSMSTLSDIYAQRVTNLGIPLWQRHGLVVSSKPMWELKPAIASDLRGGAIITWYTNVANYHLNDIYAQRIDSVGVLQWSADAVPICVADNDQSSPIVVSDGIGGAIIAWNDQRDNMEDAFAQRVDNDGRVQWTIDGVPVATGPGSEGAGSVVSDGDGGAIITWYTSPFRYAQRVNGAGIRQWTEEGVLVTDQDGGSATTTSDGRGGAVLLTTSFSIPLLAQRISPMGELLWGPDGISVTSMSDPNGPPHGVSDGNGGLFAVWAIYVEPFEYDVYAQRVDSLGQLMWGEAGVPISLANLSQSGSKVALDWGDGCIVAWVDKRRGVDLDIYAQHVAGDGTLTHTPSQVDLASPDDGAIVTTDTLSIVWQPSLPFVERYWLEGATDSLFAVPFVDSLITDTVRTIGFLEHDQRYWWRVRARNSYGWGQFSEVRNFFVYQEIPAAPALLDPPDGAIGIPTTPTLVWNSSVGSENYLLQVSDTSDFSTLVVDEENIDSTSYPVELGNNLTYYWRVSATNDLGTSDWSEVWSFTTLATSVDDQATIPTEFSLNQNYPNPFNPSTTIKYGLPQKAHVKLEIFNILGQSVAVLADDEEEPGYDSVNFESSRLASGLYLYRIRAGDFVETKKLIVLR